jgi:nucleotide-binding universal stress UspA family protein
MSVHAVYLTDIRQYETSLIADVSGMMGALPYQNAIDLLRDLEDKKAEFIREMTAKRFSTENIPFTFTHQTGLLADLIQDLENDHDIVMAGKRGMSAETAIGHLGSNMERLIRASQKPCMVTNRGFSEIKRIAIANDDGESCRKAIDFIESSALFKGLDIHILTVIDNEDEATCLDRVNYVEKRLSRAGFTTTAQVLYGQVDLAITDYVENEGIDLLVMGAYGHSRIREFLIGSTTTALLMNCHIPVLCFR